MNQFSERDGTGGIGQYILLVNVPKASISGKLNLIS